MFDNRLDRTILADGVATFDDDKDTLAALNHAALQLDELDLQPDQQRVIPMATQMLRKWWPVLHGSIPPSRLTIQECRATRGCPHEAVHTFAARHTCRILSHRELMLCLHIDTR